MVTVSDTFLQYEMVHDFSVIGYNNWHNMVNENVELVTGVQSTG